MKYVINCILAMQVSFTMFSQKSTIDSLQVSSDSISSSWTYEGLIYYYFLPDEANTTTLMGYVDHKALHLEARYNYEGMKTTSIFGGYNFEFGKELKFDFTPMVGFLLGKTNGLAPGLEVDITWKKLDFHIEGEYIFDFEGKENDFYYSWSELAVTPLRNFRTGISVSRTLLFKSDLDIQKGIFTQYTIGKFTAGIDYFNPFSNDHYLIATLDFAI